MDLKKLFKLLGFSEQFTSKSKIFSGFGLGVIGSVLLLTVFFLNHPLKASLLYPVFQGINGIGGKSPLGSWPFQLPSTYVSSNSSVLQNSTNSNGGDGVALERSKNGSSFGSNDVGLVTNQTHEGISSAWSKNSSFGDISGGKSVPKKTQSGNLSESDKNSRLADSSGGESVSEKTHSGKFTQSEKNASSSRVEGRVNEKTHQGNLSREANSTNNSRKEGGDSAKTHEVKFAENKGVNVSNSGESVRSNATKESVGDDFAKCDIFDGRWVRDEGKPFYPAGSCPHIDRDFDCFLNGRPDSEFLKWRWQPNHCNIPSLNATDFLERLRGKRLVFVGDSLNRNMWESLVCILRQSVANKKKVYEISGKKEFKKKGFYAFHYEDFNCSIDFVSSPFLVRESSVNSNKGLTETLRLDLMDKTAPMYHDADVIVFNTGHWWTHEKTSKGENYYQEGNHVYPRLKVLEAYSKALATWARWIDRNVDVHKSQVFFRGYSVTHFRGGQWNSGGQCHKESEPIYNDTYLAKYPSKMRALENVLQQMKTPVGYLNISKLTDYRKDGHPSIYRKEYETAEEKHAAESSQDCSHWCLPGVPDTWNELLYASLLQAGRGSWGN